MRKESEGISSYGRQRITEADINAVVEVLRSPFLTQGPKVETFEKAIACKVEAKYAVAVNSGTSALHIACIALGLSPGEWLWTSPISFVASANCAVYCGAKVDFVDINKETGLLNIDALKNKLKIAEKIGKLPKVLIPVHLAGCSCEMKEISLLAKKYGFKILEDASHALGGFYQGHPVGSCKYSSITIFSFHPVKMITTGEGGMATTNEENLSKIMKLLRSHGITKDAKEFEGTDLNPWTYQQKLLGYNYRISDIQCSLGYSQSQRLEEIVNFRNILRDKYCDLMENLPAKLLDIPMGVKSSVHLAIIRLNDQSEKHHRCVFESLLSYGIGVQVHYSPIHLQPFYKNMGFKEGDFPIAENYSKNAISLPLHLDLKTTDIELIVSQLSIAIENCST